MLMNADRRRVDDLQIAIVSLRHRFKDLIPDAELPPSHEAVITGGRGTMALGNVGPGRARPQPPINAVQNPPIIHTCHAARLVRQKRLDDRPLKVRSTRIGVGS
jgi:hypothetical protein